MNSSSKRTVRNLIIFVIGIIAIPWLGCWLDVQSGNPTHNQDQSLGWLLFIVTPLALVILLRLFGRDWQDFGLKPNFRGNGKWYLFALLFHPISIFLILLVGAVIGLTSIPDLSAAKFALIGQTILAMLIPNFIKNIFEEFAWRGYLAPKVQSVLRNQVIGHILVGVIWFTWHLPYYLALLTPADLQKSSSLVLGILLLMTFLGIIPTAIVYGELRARTNSVWPAVLIHMSANIFFDALVTQKFFSFSSGLAELIFSPALLGIVVVGLNTAVGLWLYRTRMQTVQGAQNA